MSKLIRNLSSIRWRLTLWFTFALALALAVFSLTVYLAMRQALTTQFEATLRDGTHSLGEYLEHEFEEGDSEPSAANGLVRDSSFRNFAIEVYAPDGRLLAASEELHPKKLIANLNLPEILAGTGDDSPMREIRNERFDLPDFKIAAVRVVHPKTEQSYAVVVGARQAVVTDELATLKKMLLTLSPVLLLLAAIGGFYLSKRALRPVSEMTAQARQMNANRLSNRLSIVNPHDELGQLGATFNELFDRIEVSFEQMRRFIADASHELRTPVTVIRSETDVALTAPRSETEAFQSLEVIRDESTRLSRLVEDMFTLARADADDRNMLSNAPVRIAEIIETCARSAAVLGRSRGVSVELCNRLSADLLVDGDRIRIAQMILNILDNATKYTPSGGNLKIEARVFGDAGTGEVRIQIEDDGPGIPDELKKAVFTRFYRGDKARTRDAGGGSGLGLPIALAIAEAHDGGITLADSATGGCLFTINLPLYFGAADGNGGA